MYEMSSSLNGKAASITLTGRTGNTEDILNGAIGGNNSYTLSISTTVPVMITNLKITGGQAGLSLGYDEENSANVEVSVTLGEGCLVTDNGNSSGINLNAGTLILDGASITANCCEYGGGVSVSGGNFIMISGTIGGTTEDDANTSDYRGAGVYISGGTFTMKGGTICGNKTSSGSGAGVYVGFENAGSDDETCGTFIMEGGTISGNESGTAGGGVFVDGYDSDSALTGTVTFTMSGGTITGNTNTSTYDEGERGGGGVALYGEKAEFIMEGGTITANESSCYGGAVSVTGGAKFTMNAGTIGGTSSAEGNKVTLAGYSSYGAGVYVGDSATFTMEGGSISYNSTSSTGSTTGGGAVCAYSGTFIMNGGTLSNNSSAGSGGAVYIGSTGTFEMTGGTVTGNSCGSEGSGKAVYVRTNGSDSGTLTMGGSAVIASGNDVYLPSGAVITITEAFDGDIETAAVITPETYSTDITVLAAGLDDDDGNTLVELEYEYDVFAVTPEGTTIYIVSSEGKLIVSE
ncbi:hypothetical protein [Treponema sp.]|uniref:hypothetical protein n=1 Tax=Treponema sp. TaxID=166 RepID=UPI0038906E7D